MCSVSQQFAEMEVVHWVNMCVLVLTQTDIYLNENKHSYMRANSSLGFLEINRKASENNSMSDSEIVNQTDSQTVNQTVRSKPLVM